MTDSIFLFWSLYQHNFATRVPACGVSLVDQEAMEIFKRQFLLIAMLLLYLQLLVEVMGPVSYLHLTSGQILRTKCFSVEFSFPSDHHYPEDFSSLFTKLFQVSHYHVFFL